MFTKYNGINLPNNYSGTKFRQPIEDTTMKTHRALDEKVIQKGVVRTSVSPTFQNALNSTIQEAREIESFSDDEHALPHIDNSASSSFFEEEVCESTAICEDNNDYPSSQFDSKCDIGDKNDKEAHPLNLLKESGLGKLIDNLNKDDILLIALIVIFAQEHSANSLDAIVILALLLLYH